MLGVPSSFEEFALADKKVEFSEHVHDGDIVANELSEVEPEPEDNDDDEESEQITLAPVVSYILSYQKAFMQWNKFPVEVLQQLHAFDQLIVCQQVKTWKKQTSLMSFFN